MLLHGRSSCSLEHGFHRAVVVLIQPTRLDWFTLSSRAPINPLVIAARTRHYRQPAIGPELSFIAKPVWGDRRRQDLCCSNATDTWHAADRFVTGVFARSPTH